MNKYNLRSTKARTLKETEKPVKASLKKSSKNFKRIQQVEEMANPTFTDMEDFLTSLSEIKELCPLVKASGPLDVNKYDFNGFDPTRTLNRLLKLIQGLKKTKKDAVKDILDMIVVGLTRGNIREDQIARTATEDGMNRINELVKSYGIRQRSSSNERITLKNDDFSFIRMTLLFPHVSAAILDGSPTIVKRGAKSALGSEHLPNCMKFSGFSALIPEKLNIELFVILKYASMAYQVDFSCLINPSLAKKSLKQMYEIQLPFWTAGNRGGWLTDAQRVSYLCALELNTLDEFRKILKVACAAAKEFKDIDVDAEEFIQKHTKGNVIVWPEGLEDKDTASNKKLLEESFVIENQVVVANQPERATSSQSGSKTNYQALL